MWLQDGAPGLEEIKAILAKWALSLGVNRKQFALKSISCGACVYVK